MSEDNNKICFLDFDGVLNSTRHFLVNKPERFFAEPEQQFDIYNVKNLEWFLNLVPDVMIVVESTWGYNLKLDQIKEIMTNIGMSKENVDKFIAITPRWGNSMKDDEIIRYLEQHPEVTEWIVIDDWEIFGESPSDPDQPMRQSKQLKTDPNHGFTIMDAIHAVRHFDKRYKIPHMGW